MINEELFSIGLCPHFPTRLLVKGGQRKEEGEEGGKRMIRRGVEKVKKWETEVRRERGVGGGGVRKEEGEEGGRKRMIRRGVEKVKEEG